MVHREKCLSLLSLVGPRVKAALLIIAGMGMRGCCGVALTTCRVPGIPQSITIGQIPDGETVLGIVHVNEY